MKKFSLWGWTAVDKSAWIKVWAEGNHGDFMKKHAKLPKRWCAFLLNMTGDHSKQFRPCLKVIQNNWFQLEIVIWGKIDCYQNFVCWSFLSRKNEPI